MRMSVMFTLYATPSKEQTGDLIMLAQFEEGNILTKTHKYVESGDESDNKSIMMSKQEIDAINAGDVSYHDHISTEILEDIRDGSQTHPNINIREARYKIRDRISHRQPKWKGVIKATLSMGKVLHKLLVQL